ncbi:hypothetical protein ROZALSC1DRAFT_22266, partial [Rozella allomycis CSF55]
TNKDVWLDAARNFRIAKNSLTSNERKIDDLKSKTKNIKNEIESSKIKLETLKKINSGSSEAILEDLRREVKMSTYLIEDTYPKELQTLKIKIKASQQVIDNPLNFESEWDLLPLQKELETLQQKLNQINQAKAFENDPLENKIGMYRQQASMAAAKKAARADELIQLSKDEEQLSKAAQTKSDLLPKLLTPEGLKDFVAELRVKSNDYKSKKTLLAAMASEVSILERTEQVLQNEKSVLDQQYQSLNLTRTSHDKALLGELSKVLDEIQNETNHLLTKKSDLGSIKNNFSQLSSNYKAKKKAFDLAMAHLESEASPIEQELKSQRKDINDFESQIFETNLKLNHLEILSDQVIKVQYEMKAYVGASFPSVDSILNKNNCKTYRELYQKTIHELEMEIETKKDKYQQIREMYDSKIAEKSVLRNLIGLMEVNLPSYDLNEECQETEVDEDRRATWMELFYDIFFVAVFSKLSKRDSIITNEGLIDFTFVFVPVWWSWFQVTIFSCRFDIDDLYHRFILLIQMLAVTAFAGSIKYATENDSMRIFYSISFITIQFTLFVNYGLVGIYVKNAKLFALKQCLNHFFSIAFWTTSIFIPMPYNIIVWFISIGIQAIIQILEGEKTRKILSAGTEYLHSYSFLRCRIVVILCKRMRQNNCRIRFETINA